MVQINTKTRYVDKKQKIIAVDLDETLCTGSKPYSHLGIGKYSYCVPIQKNIDKVNKFYNEGHTIIIYTSRGMGTLGGDLGVIYNTLYEPTKRDLERWGVKFHQLVFGKIYFDVLIDDKVCNVEDIDKLFIEQQ